MKLNRDSLALYAVTDRHWTQNKSLYEQVKESLEGGVTMVQLREKNISEEDFKKEALELKKLCSSYKVPFVINDNVLLAKETDADGVHIGQSDMELIKARQLLGKDKIIGVSAQTLEEALEAQENGADYLGVGAVFNTSTKDDAIYVSPESLKEICSKVKIPVVAIGGINQQNLSLLKKSGIAGAAIISAIFSAPDIKEACSNLLKKIKEVI
ncbi:thiamine phosphate synthase [Treponema sp.]|uniref:thiamine phosphate synthase n=1 Tax=Treponema sp. TaxID=166 RepID=UPI0025D9EB4A|nr:thiamine phosphate synthase [Treponema sp.]MCR5217486.1 thiamine phosphate synthase [Treponema sp.]